MGAVKLRRLLKLRDLLQELDPVAKPDKAGKRARSEKRHEFAVKPVVDLFEGSRSGLYAGDNINGCLRPNP